MFPCEKCDAPAAWLYVSALGGTARRFCQEHVPAFSFSGTCVPVDQP